MPVPLASPTTPPKTPALNCALEPIISTYEDVDEEEKIDRENIVKDSLNLDSAKVVEKEIIDTVWIETDKLICGISEKGGKIVTIQMKDRKSDG